MEEAGEEGEAACATKMAAINVPAHFVSLQGSWGCGRLLLLSLPLMLFRQDEALKNALCDVSCGSIPAQVEAPPLPLCVYLISTASLSVCLPCLDR